MNHNLLSEKAKNKEKRKLPIKKKKNNLFTISNGVLFSL